MKCHTRLHPTRVITPAFVRNENVFFSTLVPYIAHKQTMWAQITRCRYGARSGSTLFGKKREADNFLSSVLVYSSGQIVNTKWNMAVFIMIVAFHLRSEWIMELKSITVKAVLVFITGHTLQTYMECGIQPNHIRIIAFRQGIKRGWTLPLHWCLIKLNIGQQIRLWSYAAQQRCLNRHKLIFWTASNKMWNGSSCLLVWFDALCRSQQSFSFVGTGLPGLDQYLARMNVSC